MSADFNTLGRLFFDWARNNLNLWEWEVSEELLPLFQQCGMVELVAYDPTLHGITEDADPGDTIWHWTMPARAALEADPAPVVGAPTLEEMDEICCEHNFHYEDMASLKILVEIAHAVLARYGTTPPPRVEHILRLAEVIREVDDNHSLGAAALAEAILSHPGVRDCGIGTTPAPAPIAGRSPDGYAYRYPDPFVGTVLRFNGGQEVNGGRPIEAVPYWLGTAPAPVPVPVSEPLPGAKDCDDEGRCWFFHHSATFGSEWFLSVLPRVPEWYRWQSVTHWLPAHTLPLPEVAP